MKCNPPVDLSQPVLPKSWDPDNPGVLVYKAYRCPKDLQKLMLKSGMDVPDEIPSVLEALPPGSNWVEMRVEGSLNGKGFRTRLGFSIEGRDGTFLSETEYDGDMSDMDGIDGDLLPYITCTPDFRKANDAFWLVEVP